MLEAAADEVVGVVRDLRRRRIGKLVDHHGDEEGAGKQEERSVAGVRFLRVCGAGLSCSVPFSRDVWLSGGFSGLCSGFRACSRLYPGS